MPPLLMKLVFDKVRTAPVPFFVKPVRQGHRRQGDEELHRAQHRAPARLHGGRTRDAALVCRRRVQRRRHPDELPAGSRRRARRARTHATRSSPTGWRASTRGRPTGARCRSAGPTTWPPEARSPARGYDTSCRNQSGSGADFCALKSVHTVLAAALGVDHAGLVGALQRDVGVEAAAPGVGRRSAGPARRPGTRAGG